MKWFHRATLDRPGTDAAGGGIEWAYAANWTAKVEYAYFDFGKLDTTGVSTFAEREMPQPTGGAMHGSMVVALASRNAPPPLA